MCFQLLVVSSDKDFCWLNSPGRFTRNTIGAGWSRWWWVPQVQYGISILNQKLTHCWLSLPYRPAQNMVHILYSPGFPNCFLFFSRVISAMSTSHASLLSSDRHFLGLSSTSWFQLLSPVLVVSKLFLRTVLYGSILSLVPSLIWYTTSQPQEQPNFQSLYPKRSFLMPRDLWSEIPVWFYMSSEQHWPLSCLFQNPGMHWHQSQEQRRYLLFVTKGLRQ